MQVVEEEGVSGKRFRLAKLTLEYGTKLNLDCWADPTFPIYRV